jgi:hypothetical protein
LLHWLSIKQQFNTPPSMLTLNSFAKMNNGRAPSTLSGVPALAFAAMLLVQGAVHGQGFNRTYDPFGTFNAQRCEGVEFLGDGYLLFSNHLHPEPPDGEMLRSALLTHINASGDVVWHKRTALDTEWSVQLPEDASDSIPGGGFWYINQTGQPVVHVLLMRFDEEGDTLWTRRIRGYNGGGLSLRDGHRTSDGGYILVAWDTSLDLAVSIKTDEDGDELWRRFHISSSWVWETSFTKVKTAPNGDIYLSGFQFLEQDPTNARPWFCRTSTEMDEWCVTDSSSYNTRFLSVDLALDGHPVVFGWRSSVPWGTTPNPFISKVDSTDGSILWEKRFYSPGARGVFHVGKVCPNGDLIAVGLQSFPQQSLEAYGLIALCTSEGDSLWTRLYRCYECSPQNDAEFSDVLPTPDGGFIATGTWGRTSLVPTNSDIWVVKMDSMGCILPGCAGVGITEQYTDLLEAISIHPNPTSSSATLSLDLPPELRDEQLGLTLVAQDGRVVYNEVIRGVSEHLLPLDGLPAGLYYVHVSHGSKWLTGSMVAVL